MLRPQTFGPFVDSCGTCAMGAALEAVDRLVKTTGANERRIKKIWPWLSWPMSFAPTLCPRCHKTCSFTNIFSLIVHLNDKDRLPRQAIADAIVQVEKGLIAQLELTTTEHRERILANFFANLKAVPKRRVKLYGHQTQATGSGNRETADRR